jgi:predicted enzyme related to lactoylglutathione lyase
VSTPRLIEVELYVADIERSVAFYADVIGVPLEGHAHAEDEPTHHHAAWGDWEAGAEGGFLLFSLYSAGPGEATRSSFGFAVDDLDAVHRRVEATGIKVLQAPTTRPWGRCATYQDADGNRVSLTQA